ncbi:MAG: hypothetical protein WBB85_03530 [Albidovulum sp.]|uniref:hypothetical protein n=1 Tax=Albidovulum sp. TaxID=1872424 RepID=UPI003CAC20B4
MAEALIPTPATDAAGYLDRRLDLRLDEEFHLLTECAAPLPKAMDDALQVAGTPLGLGQTRATGNGRLIRLWPARLWCLGTLPSGLDLRATDISHGHVILRLRGPGALHFLADYASADLRAAPIRSAATLRCAIGAYAALLWWANTRDVHIAIDRSLAQSFTDHLRDLTRRHPAHHLPE